MTLALRTKWANLLWLEPHRAVTGGTSRPLSGLPTDDQIAQSLTHLPQGPTYWVVEDTWAPSILLRDIVELPQATEAREAFFRWRFSQALALEGDHSVETLSLSEGAWLLAGLPTSLRASWIQSASRLGRPLHRLVPRWLWLYNRLAPSRERPGLLLSLCPHPEGGFTGTLAAWGRTLTLLRQWTDPATPEAWMEERVAPSAAFLQRESRTPQEFWVWGPSEWPESSTPLNLIQPEIPTQEAL